LLATHRYQLVEVLTQTFQGRKFIVTENSFPPLRFPGCIALDNFLSEGVFARKLVIEGTLGHSGQVKDFLYAGRRISNFVHALKADLDQVFAGSLHYHISNRLVR
jgi:hypothetical protein